MYGISTEISPFMHALSKEVARITSEQVKAVHSIDEDATQNRNFIVETTSGTYFLKVYSEGAASERVFEANLLKKLHKDGYDFPVQPITSTPFFVEDKPVMLFDTVDGDTLDLHSPISDEQLMTIARQLAEMHACLATFDAGAKTRFDALGFEFVEAFGLDTSDTVIRSALDSLKKAFTDVDTTKLVQTIIHDDLSPHNVMLTKAGELRFIDFDDAHRSYRISDIGTVIKEFIVGPSGSIDQEKIDRFIYHYEAAQSTEPLTDQEKRLIVPMILRRALFIYAYYSMVEKQKNLRLQSSEEYCIVASINLTDQ